MDETDESEEELDEKESEKEPEKEEEQMFDNHLDFSEKNKLCICPVFGLILTVDDLLRDGHPIFTSLISSHDDIMTYTYPTSIEKLPKLGLLKINSTDSDNKIPNFLMEFHQKKGTNFKFPIPGYYVFIKPRISLPKDVQKTLKRHLHEFEKKEQDEFVSFSQL